MHRSSTRIVDFSLIVLVIIDVYALSVTIIQFMTVKYFEYMRISSAI